jgi:transposase
LTLAPDGWEPLAYVAQRQVKLPAEERTQYLGQEVCWEWTHPRTGEKAVFRRRYVLRSEERATCRKVRAQQLVRAATELNHRLAGLGKGRLKTREQVEARVEKVLTARRVRPFFRVAVQEEAGQPLLEWELDQEALTAAEQLDGYYVLLTSWPPEKADASALLRRWKGEWQIERRFADWKGPLKVRPVFVTSNKRLAALVLLLHLALMSYCLLERQARRALARQGQPKVRRLLAGQVDAVPTGASILLAFEHLFLLIEEEEHGRDYHVSEMFPEQADLWKLLGCQMPAWC